MRKASSWISIAALLILAGSFAALTAGDQPSPAAGERAKAVNAVRLINTAELRYLQGTKPKSDAIEAHNRYASWDELYKSGALKVVQGEWAAVKDVDLSAGPEVLPGYHLDLVVSADGKAYALALHDNKPGDGHFAVFSDQNGLIFTGAPIQ